MYERRQLHVIAPGFSFSTCVLLSLLTSDDQPGRLISYVLLASDVLLPGTRGSFCVSRESFKPDTSVPTSEGEHTQKLVRSPPTASLVFIEVEREYPICDIE